MNLKNFSLFFILMITTCFALGETVGFYTGTFDPPHNGHLNLMVNSIEALKLDSLYVLPNYMSKDKPAASLAEFRHEMVKRMIGENSKIKIIEFSDIKEAYNKNPEGYIDNLIDAINLKGGNNGKFYQLCGTDSFNKMVSFDKLPKSFENRVVAVIKREKYEAETDPNVEALLKKERVVLLNFHEKPISSTFIRKSLGEGKIPYDLLSETVINYILEKGLYGISEFVLLGKKNFFTGYPALNPDKTVNAVIEIPAGTNDKWEVIKDRGYMKWDMKNEKPRVVDYLSYPVNYGIVPGALLSKTLGGDGDPLDILVLGPALPRGTILKVKILGLISLTEDGEKDDKILAVREGTPFFNLNSMKELENTYEGLTSIIETWFINYKREKKLVSGGFKDEKSARLLINQAISEYEKFFQNNNSLNLKN